MSKMKGIKPLTKYVEDVQSKVFDDNGAFFAFSDKQLNEQRKEGVDYVLLGEGSGLICPRENAKVVMDGVSSTHKAGVELRLKDYTVSQIAQYELSNHEAQISYDLDIVRDVLADYGVDDEMFKKEYHDYMDYCRENDLF